MVLSRSPFVELVNDAADLVIKGGDHRQISALLLIGNRFVLIEMFSGACKGECGASEAK